MHNIDIKLEELKLDQESVRSLHMMDNLILSLSRSCNRIEKYNIIFFILFISYNFFHSSFLDFISSTCDSRMIRYRIKLVHILLKYIHKKYFVPKIITSIVATVFIFVCGRSLSLCLNYDIHDKSRMKVRRRSFRFQNEELNRF